MRLRRLTAPLLFALAVACAVAAGPGTFAKLAYMLGFPGLALHWIENQAARGAALYVLGRYAEADEVFATVGRTATYDRANSLAATGRYELSVAYYDAVLFADRWDADARYNREIVDALVEPVIGEAMGHGRIEMILQQAGADPRPFDPANPHAAIVPVDTIRKRPDAKTVAASREWLDTLADAPGEYLRKRLAAEYDRRRAEGAPEPREPSPW